MPKKEGAEHSSILYIRASSVEDICRLACTFDYGSDNLLMTNEKKGSRLAALGEHVGNVVIAYYVTVKEKGKLISYTPAKGDETEKAVFTSGSVQQSGAFNINVIGTDLSTFDGDAKVSQKDIAFVRIDASDDLIRAVIKKGVETESLTHLYSFIRKGKRYLGTFDLFKELENDRKLFYYSPFNNKTQARYARYNYNRNELDFTDSVGEHSYMYVKIINLDEAYPFFNPMPD